MTKPDLLQTGPMLPIIETMIDEAFTVHRLWQADDPDALMASLADKIVAIATGGHVPVTAGMMGQFPNLKIVANFGVGYDSVDAPWAGQNGVIVTNTPDVLSDEVADTTLGLMLMTVRELGAAERYLRAGSWPDGAFRLSTTTMAARSVGILGLGRIGKAVASRLEAFNVKIAYHGRTKQDVPYPYFANLMEMAEAVDTLVSVLPGTDATHHMINADVLKALGPDGIVINIGRGSVIDEAALVQALKDGAIKSAGLDVFEFEPQVPADLIAMDHVTLLPHVGSASTLTRDAMGKLVADNLIACANGEAPVSPVAETPFSGW